MGARRRHVSRRRGVCPSPTCAREPFHPRAGFPAGLSQPSGLEARRSWRPWPRTARPGCNHPYLPRSGGQRVLRLAKTYRRFRIKIPGWVFLHKRVLSRSRHEAHLGRDVRRSRDDGGAGDEAYERDDEDGRLAGLGGGRADERLRLEVRGERGVRVHGGAVECALGWACWKTYLGRPETEKARRFAMTELGNGLCSAKQYEDALLVDEARLSLLQRIDASENSMLVAQSNLANTYAALGRHKEA